MQIAIVLYDGLTALDAVGPYEVLARLEGVEVVFVGQEARVYRADTGFLGLSADKTFHEVPHPDVIVVPGGPVAWSGEGHEELIAWLKEAHRKSTWTTSVCTGAFFLAAAGILKGKPAATHWAARQQLTRLGAVPIDMRVAVTRADHVMTSAGVSAGIDMALMLVAELRDPGTAMAIQLLLEYDPKPPYDSGSPTKASQQVIARVLEHLAKKR
jgi:transcriptional regulator GlxA family with amidase domain